MVDPFQGVKDAFCRYATGVTVVSCTPPEGETVAITVNSFTSVSLRPTMVLWCLELQASVYQHFMDAPSYAVSVLAHDQQDLCMRFATPGQHAVNAEDGVKTASGAVLLNGRLAGFDCQIVARHLAGDHVVLVGEVISHDYTAGKPLVYAGRQFLTGPHITEPSA